MVFHKHIDLPVLCIGGIAFVVALGFGVAFLLLRMPTVLAIVGLTTAAVVLLRRGGDAVVIGGERLDHHLSRPLPPAGAAGYLNEELEAYVSRMPEILARGLAGELGLDAGPHAVGRIDQLELLEVELSGERLLACVSGVGEAYATRAATLLPASSRWPPCSATQVT